MNRFALLLCVAAAFFTSRTFADEAAEKLILATYKLANDASTATGFVVHRSENGELRYFVVTANHVLHQMNGDSCILVSRTRGEDGVFQRNEIKLNIRAGGKQLWREDNQHDIAVLPLPEGISVVSLPLECLATEASLSTVYTGDEVITAVFPERSEANNAGFPILRGGTIASYPLRPVDPHSKFLVDATTWKGDSGGAVAHRTIRYQQQWPLIIGVTHGMQNITDTVKESRFVERRTDYPLGVSVVGHAIFARRLLDQ